jgi:hypothetical protein
MQQFAVVDDTAAYNRSRASRRPTSATSAANAVSNMVNMKLDEAPDGAQFLQLFDQIWHNPDQLEDVTEARLRPHRVGLRRELAGTDLLPDPLQPVREFLDDISEDVLPNDRTGYQETAVWKSLYNFQRDAATGIINKLETYNGCILADSVGLGKTFTALAVIKYYELRNKSVLVLAPKKLAENWTNYNANLTTNIFAKDRFNYDVLAHTDLSRTRGESLGLRLDRINWGNYDLVVIDESHNFRNADYAEEKESRYQRLMRQVIREGVKTKVLMLSATPVNNRFNDLKNQLAAGLRGRVREPLAHLNISTTSRRCSATPSGRSTSGPSSRPEERTHRRASWRCSTSTSSSCSTRSRSPAPASTSRRSTTPARSGPFPSGFPRSRIREPLTDLPGAELQRDLRAAPELNLAVYTPLAYVFPSRREKYEDLYNVEGGTARTSASSAASRA